ncbi:hypothetical protein Glove_276g80 [Diversispora epigaea]|uniref:Uncharacterized protein n=1 Tax=Diversispora epigaea TaxID=1348612 RepID=A0A397I6U3_9GLOM|nr:hypothetical protein Glove_276g80 [Diversispora epigaea]
MSVDSCMISSPLDQVLNSWIKFFRVHEEQKITSVECLPDNTLFPLFLETWEMKEIPGENNKNINNSIIIQYNSDEKN